MELCRRHLCRGKSAVSVSTALGVGVPAMTQNRKRLEMRMKMEPVLRRQFENAAAVSAISLSSRVDP
jgi:hypothetical protein